MTINKGKTNEELVQKYLARKKVREQEPKPIEEPLEEKVEGENGLVYAVDKIIALFREGQDDIIITERDNFVNAICAYRGILYDAGDDQTIFITQANAPIKTLQGDVVTRSRGIQSLCAHRGVLFDSGNYSGVYTLATDTSAVNVLNSKQRGTEDKHVLTLCSHNKRLHHVENGKDLYCTIGHDFIQTIEPCESFVTNLCSHNGELYHAETKSIYKTLTGEKIAEREGWVRALCSHNGELYDGGDYGMRETRSNRIVNYSFVKPYVRAMCSVPPEIVDEITFRAGKQDKSKFYER
ncbi:hypothetical protein GOV06_04140 [Candidatus Woesearchaeota archaeon]|nr:hypothetical protein [Candidatus Woesearchaeota archaeon]